MPRVSRRKLERRQPNFYENVRIYFMFLHVRNLFRETKTTGPASTLVALTKHAKHMFKLNAMYQRCA